MDEAPSEAARRIIEEEQELLARTRKVLEAAEAEPPQRRFGTQPAAELRALRDEAATAAARDLPALFQQMIAARALAERPMQPPRPDSRVPYFAHLRLRDAHGARDYLLGRGTFADTAAGVRIIDWRHAPVARLFYNYREGEAYEEELPGGVAEGVVEARRIVVIERGELTRILAGSWVLTRGTDGTWRSEGAGGLTGGGTGTAARAGALGVGVGASGRPRTDITALLDTEQFEALAASGRDPLLVLGSAGSGKTTVALHRLAKLAFDDPGHFAPSRLRVVVPEEGLARLSRRLLEPLGLEHVRVDTLDDWLYHSACVAFRVGGIKRSPETPPLVSSLKRHPALLPALERRLGPPRAHIQTRMHALRAQLAELFTDRSFLRSVVDASGGDLPLTAIESTIRHTMLQLATPLSSDLEGIDAERMRTLDGLSLEEGTAEAAAGAFDPEDVALLLYLRTRGAGLEPGTLAHAVLDEAEDFSLFEIAVLGHQLGNSRSCTLAGDEMQQTHSSFAGWSRMLATLGAHNAATVRLQVSYRCPRPVVAIAHRVLGTQASGDQSPSGRDGAPVGIHRFPGEGPAHLFLAGALRDLLDREPAASVGVIAANADTARRLYGALETLPGVRLVLDGRFSFEPGIDVTEVDEVKGLEFDYVIIPDATASAYPPTDEARRRLHVAVTRTSYQLWLVTSGSLTPLVEDTEFAPSDEFSAP